MYGLLGPNGAGKTTTVKLLLGLSRPTSGSVRLFGQVISKSLSGIHLRIGSVLEAPSYYPTLSPRENLKVLSRTACDSRSLRRIDQLLGELGLSDRLDDQVRDFSLGMRQKVGLAAALLHDPELVVLDEPFAHLDPLAIRTVTDLILSLRHQGKTIFLSTHLLSEADKLCDTVAFVNHGSLIVQSSVEALRSQRRRLRITVEDHQRATSILANRGWKPILRGSSILVRSANSSDINSALFQEGVVASEVCIEEATIEEIFHSLSVSRSAHRTQSE